MTNPLLLHIGPNCIYPQGSISLVPQVVQAWTLAFVCCSGRQTSLGQAFTDTTGFVRVIFQSADGITFDRSKCALYVRLPVASCSVLPPTGLLYGSLSLIEFVQSTVGLLANLVFGLPQRA
ncbi:hypothetical protein NMG60_11003537 [Bertholletia excelsa]